MDAVKAFNEELSGIYEAKPPISRAKMTLLTKKAIKGIKFYKHIVQSMEKFVQKCRPEYKVPGLYVIDSVVRQSRHQFGPEKDVFMPRLCKNIITTFQHIYKCPPEDKPRVLRVLNLWQKNTVFPQDIVQQLTVMGGAPTPDVPQSMDESLQNNSQQSQASHPDPANLTNLLANLLANPDPSQIQNLAGLLSSSQQSQLEDLLKQVKGADQPNHNEPPPPKPNHSNNQPGVFQPQQSNEQPPFLHAQQPPPQLEPRQPTFNRDVLDFDYSDEEQTPPTNSAKQPHGIDMALLAKLPTADQIQQLTHGSMPPRLDSQAERMQRLEQEQEMFNKQIQQMSSVMSDRSESLQRSDRSDSHRRRRSRSRSNDRHHRHHRRRSHSREHRSRRSRSRDRSRRLRRSHSRSHEMRREKKGFPPTREGCISVCTTTLWIGNISAKIMQHELQAMVEEYGEIESINMIPPRGCAYICMKKRTEADHALHKIRHARLGQKTLKCDWAPSKEMPEEQKPTWVKEFGVNYVPLSNDPNQLKILSTWGFIDSDSLPESKKGELSAAGSETNVSELEPLQQTPPPAMMAAFNPAVSGMMPNVAMVPRPQMPMMVRPFQVNPYGVVQPRMGFRPPLGNEPHRDMQRDLKPEPTIVGSTTPTADERNDEVPPPPQSLPQFQPPYGSVQVAQRFPGGMPVQLRMMPAMGQPIMPPRMGMMPIRMGIPMQLRPGFHPGMQARMPMHGRPQMMPNQMQQPMHPMQQPQIRQQVAGFPGAIRMSLPGQVRLPIIEAQPPESSILPNNPTNHEHERRPGSPSVVEEHSDPRRESEGNSEGDRQKEFNMQRDLERPTPRDERPPPREFNQFPPNHDRPNRNSFDRLPGPPPREFDRPPREFGRPPDFDRGSRDGERPTRDTDRPPRDLDRSRDSDRPSRDMDRPPRDGDRPPRDMNRGSESRDRDRRDYDRGRRDRSRERDRDRRDMDRDHRGRDGGRDFGRGFRDFDRGGRYDRRDRGGPPFRGGRPFRGRDDWGRRGNDRGGFRGRGRGWGRDERRRSPEVDPEEEEYQRKRKETLRKRHEEEEDYVVEKIDYTSFGLPSGFGGPSGGSEEEDSGNPKQNQEDKPDNGLTSTDSSLSRKDVDDAAKSRREWLEEQNQKSTDDSTEGQEKGLSPPASPSEKPPSTEEDVHLSSQQFEPNSSDEKSPPPVVESEVPCDSEPSLEPAIPPVQSTEPDRDMDLPSNPSDVPIDDCTDMNVSHSPGTPTYDEQLSHSVDQEETPLQETSEENPSDEPALITSEEAEADISMDES